jgi:hypothetical protein
VFATKFALEQTTEGISHKLKRLGGENVLNMYIFSENKKSSRKHLILRGFSDILLNAVTLIALKREVAATMAGFPWSECQVRKLATSHCTTIDSLQMRRMRV